MTTATASGERQQPGLDEQRAPAGASSWLVEARQFVAAVSRSAAKDSGARAALRSGVGKGLDDVPRMHRIVAPLLPGGVLRDPEGQRAFYTVAALIAAYHRHGALGPGEPSGQGEGDAARLVAAAAGAEPDSGAGVPRSGQCGGRRPSTSVASGSGTVWGWPTRPRWPAAAGKAFGRALPRPA
ncbi:type I-E CRISPR-associated protein Cse2/CasB [Streptomyces lydicus]|nr:type I-E CRISPR-associated protein Cse2/CasB [Streptomyces lydicus]